MGVSTLFRKPFETFSGRARDLRCVLERWMRPLLNSAPGPLHADTALPAGSSDKSTSQLFKQGKCFQYCSFPRLKQVTRLGSKARQQALGSARITMTFHYACIMPVTSLQDGGAGFPVLQLRDTASPGGHSSSLGPLDVPAPGLALQPRVCLGQLSRNEGLGLPAQDWGGSPAREAVLWPETPSPVG